MKSIRVFLLIIVSLYLVACAPVPNPDRQPDSDPDSLTVLTWERTGGIAGFCDLVIVHESRAANIANCKSDISERIQLTEGQQAQLDAWLKTLQPIDYHESDPAVSDSMTISLRFAGKGTKEADEETINLISQFAGDIASQVVFDKNAPPEKDEAEQALRNYLTALNQENFTLGAKLYGGSIDLLQVWNPDIQDDLPALFQRACTQNGLVCMNPLSIVYRGIDEIGNYIFRVEFSNPDGSLFQQGPCCGEEDGVAVTNFLFRVVRSSSGFVVLDLPPYVP